MEIAQIEILLLVACVIAVLARRLKLPYTVGLVFAGIGMALLNLWPEVPIDRDVLFNILLPPLVFEAAFAIRWTELKHEIGLIVCIATLGVLLAVALVCFGMTALVHWGWPSALVFSALIVATDPVAVIAMLKEHRVVGRFRLLIEAESLLNDGTAAALFVVALAAITSGKFLIASAVPTFLALSIGGLAIGIGTGYACTILMGRATDHLVEIALSTVAAWGSFLLAEHFGLSGILATLAAGLVIGNYGPSRGMSEKGKVDSETFWEFAAFVANSLVFLMVGLKLGKHSYAGLWPEVLCAIPLVLLSRVIAVLASCACFSRSALKVAWREQWLLVWGGLRGALALALALSIPPATPHYQNMIGVTFAVVAFSVIVQGITIGPILRRSRLSLALCADPKALRQ